MMTQNHTAFPVTEARLKELIKFVDAERFKTKRIPACLFLSKECQGICCSLPVAVTTEEAEVLSRLAKEASSKFCKIGLKLKGEVIRFDSTTGRRYLVKRRRSFMQMNKITSRLLAQSEQTISVRDLQNLVSTCVWATGEGACALQVLAEKEGRHKWFYKPINCWKYPLSIQRGRLTVPLNLGNSHFPCNRDQSVLAYDGLAEELKFLGQIIGRDVYREILKD